MTVGKKWKSKFGSVRITVDGEAFDSKVEQRDWFELKAREMAGEITDLRRQVPFKMEVNGMLVATYHADFVFRENGNLVVMDRKSAATAKDAYFRLKMRLLKALHGIDVRIVK